MAGVDKPVARETVASSPVTWSGETTSARGPWARGTTGGWPKYWTGRVGVSARVIFGSDDTEYASSTPRVAVEQLRAPTSSIIDGAGHLSLRSSPNRVARTISALVARLARISP
jgi:pimeloyl-ACP methyl ester carboxylesterase